MDGLREGVSLRGYAQRDPKIEYQREGFGLFEEMNQRVDAHVSEILFKFELPDPVQERRAAARSAMSPDAAEQRSGLPRPPAAKKKGGKVGKVGRNEPCPCGSGKKYKKCCGAA
jgi:preprotein translocase subunit SecA